MQISEQRLQTISLLTLAVIGCGAVLHLLQNVFMPFVLGGFLALGLSPVVNFQARILRFPITLAVFMTLCLTLLLFWLGGLMISASFEQLASSATFYENQLNKALEDLPLERLHLSVEQLTTPLRRFPVENIIINVTNSFLRALTLFLLTFVFTAYLLVLLSGRTRTAGVWFEIESRIKHYLVAKAVVSVAVGLIIGLALALSGVGFALLFGLTAGLLNFVPYLGPTIASLAPWPIILLSPELSTATKLFAMFFPGTFFFFVGNFLEPRIFGVSVHLHPLGVLLVCMFWGVLWGPLGILLAAPITSATAMLLSQLEITRPVANLLRGEAGWAGEETDGGESEGERK
jgi:AI-2 transport protein TqsA